MAPQLDQLQAIFPEWDDQDLVLALQDCKGNVEDTVLAISEGTSFSFMSSGCEQHLFALSTCSSRLLLTLVRFRFFCYP